MQHQIKVYKYTLSLLPFDILYIILYILSLVYLSMVVSCSKYPICRHTHRGGQDC